MTAASPTVAQDIGTLQSLDFAPPCDTREHEREGQVPDARWIVAMRCPSCRTVYTRLLCDPCRHGILVDEAWIRFSCGARVQPARVCIERVDRL